jgi:hypothetical protein
MNDEPKLPKLTLSKTTIKNLNVVRSGIKGGLSGVRCYVSEVKGPGCRSNASGSNSSDTSDTSIYSNTSAVP